MFFASFSLSLVLAWSSSRCDVLHERRPPDRLSALHCFSQKRQAVSIRLAEGFRLAQPC